MLKHILFVVLVLFSCSALSTSLSAQALPQREIAITIDDLPAGNANNMTAADITALTTRLVATLREQKVPAVGFVNERKIYKTGEADERIASLNMWLDSGFELGNHTFGHTSLNNVPLQVWEEEVIRGEVVTKLLLAQHHMKMRYFRHPYLDTGRDLQTRRAAEAFLYQRGYQIAPITMDGWDWAYAGVYEDARKRGDTELQNRLLASYLEHTTEVFDYFEKLSRDLFGYEPKQILLLHGNWLEADHIGELFDLLRKRGYKFVSLQEALNDTAYSTPDEYVGPEGSSWLEHWAITRGKPPLNEPVFPQWVLDKSAALPHSGPGLEPQIFY